MTDTLPISKLRPSKDNPRRHLGQLAELTASIRSIGILEPIVVTKNGAGYQVVAGARRLAAAKKAGLKRVPVRVLELTALERQEAMLIENLQREDLTPLEEGHAFQRLTVELGVKQRDLAARIGRSQAHISKRLALIKLPAPALEALDSGRITLEDAGQLGKLVDLPDRITSAIEENSRFRDMRRAVERQLQEEQHDEQLATARELAEKDPAPFLEMRKGQYGSVELPKGAAWLSGDHYGNVVPLTPAKHRKFDCHAVTIEARIWGGAQLQYICTTPSLHPEFTSGGKGPLTPAEKTARAKKREHNKALREAAKVRHAFVRGLLRGRVPAAMRDDALQLLLQDWVTRETGVPYHRRGMFAASLLDIVPTKGHYGAIDNVGPIAKAGADPARRLKVALAVGIGAVEDSIGGPYPQWSMAKPYFAFLERHGYQPSPAERRELAGKAPR